MIAQAPMFDTHRAALAPAVGQPVTIGATSPISLREYQTEALTAIREAERGGTRKQMVVLPTGAGKTIVFASLIHERRTRSLILAHRDELIEQAVQKVRSVIPGCPVGVVQADQNDYWAPVVVASVQTLARANRLAPVASQSFGLVVIDEGHHAAAPTYRGIIAGTRAGEADGPLLVGVTATPDRGDGVRLDDVFDRIVYTKSLVELIAEGYLSDVRAVRVSLDIDFNQVPTTKGEFNEGELEQALSAAEQPELTALAITEQAADRQTIVFTASVKLAEQTRDALLGLNVRAEMVSGMTPRIERKVIINRFKRGITQVVCNCMVLTEGFDCPEISCVVVARPTKSRALYQQMVGRGLRIIPGKDDCLIIDIVGVTEDHVLQTSASLVGKDFSVASGSGGVSRTLLEEVAAQGALFKDPFTGRIITMPVADLFGRSRFTWRRADDAGSWQMPLDSDRSLAIVAGNTGWDIIAISAKKKTTEIVHTCLDGSVVHGVAEEYVRANGARWLTDRRAPWRSKPIDPESKQIQLAMRLGIDLEALRNDQGEILKGEVSDAIDSVMVGRQLQQFARARRRVA